VILWNNNDLSDGEILIATYAGTIQEDILVSLFELDVKTGSVYFNLPYDGKMIAFNKQVNLFVTHICACLSHIVRETTYLIDSVARLSAIQ